MTVTIRDVAARAGVSAKTVSRVMNDEQHVRPHVREVVMRVVAELGYRPNAYARSLSSARSYLIALLFDDPASGYAIAMQRGALARCRERHYHLVVQPIDPATPGWIDELADTSLSLRLDGVILGPPLGQNAELLAQLATLRIPFVSISPDDATRAGSVEIDEERAAFDMTSRLIALGHRTIGFVEGHHAHISSAKRRAGFVASMTQAGLAVADHYVRPGDFSFRSGLEAGEALLTTSPRPTAIFASNDDMALGVSVAALKLGVAVPSELAIAGFDDAPTARLAWPPITTIRQPVSEMGAAAVDILVDPGYRENMADEKFRRRLSYELVERESTATAQPASA